MADSKITDLSDGGALASGDEFVIARSGSNYKIDQANVRGILAVTKYAPATLQSKSISGTTLTAIDTTNLTVSFKVPASGAVIVTFSAEMQPPSNQGLGFGLLNHSGGAQVGETISNAFANNGAATAIWRETMMWYLTGLSAGTLALDVAAGTTGGTGTVYAMGATGAINGGKVGPALIVVQAA